MYDRYKILVDRNTNQRLLRMFMEAFDRLEPKDRANAPTVKAV